MSMGYASCYADVVDNDTIEEMFPDEWITFMEALAVEDIDLEVFAQSFDDEGYAEDHPTCVSLGLLRVRFEAKTGLKLYLNYHNGEDQGSCYDDVDGAFFSVEGMHQLTEAGKAFNRHVNRSHWVNFG